MRLNFIIAASLLALAACSGENKQKLPILGQREPVEKTVNGETVVDTIYQTVPAFSFINQDSAVVSDKDFNGKIYVTDFFFTSCPSICPVMHRNMLKVYEKFKGNDEVKLLSHTIDFKYDTPAKLKEYATKLGVSGNQWEFVRGTKDSVYTLAEKSYMVAVNEDKQAPGGFVHQGWFILVDKDKRLRGAYDGTNAEQVEQLMKDMEVLLEEYR
ncbi:SCO family protein [Pedobacter sp. SYSU D00535]|uniref:SCO family protein n=1 Tax=Pedobacter sp. SYSU D00535 TaxID=2810308 RepID=UPI001A9574AA|nr:SCO family protein [Pedobacter sp. SYSU D00535]